MPEGVRAVALLAHHGDVIVSKGDISVARRHQLVLVEVHQRVFQTLAVCLDVPDSVVDIDFGLPGIQVGSQRSTGYGTIGIHQERCRSGVVIIGTQDTVSVFVDITGAVSAVQIGALSFQPLDRFADEVLGLHVAIVDVELRRQGLFHQNLAGIVGGIRGSDNLLRRGQTDEEIDAIVCQSVGIRITEQYALCIRAVNHPVFVGIDCSEHVSLGQYATGDKVRRVDHAFIGRHYAIPGLEMLAPETGRQTANRLQGGACVVGLRCGLNRIRGGDVDQGLVSIELSSRDRVRCGVGPGFADIEHAISVRIAAGRPNRRRKGVGHRHTGQRHIPGIGQDNLVVDHVAGAIDNLTHAAGHRSYVFGNAEIRILQRRVGGVEGLVVTTRGPVNADHSVSLHHKLSGNGAGLSNQNRRRGAVG